MGRVDFEPEAGAFMPSEGKMPDSLKANQVYAYSRTDFPNILHGITRLKNIWQLKE
jgi:hypothetical protein